MAGTLQVAILSESFPPHRLGSVRSLFASVTILASALGPAIYGGLLAAGMAISRVLLGTLIAMVAATALAILAERNAGRTASGH
jgi:MFS family permease